MGSIKDENEKKHLVKAKKQYRRVPVFIVAKTNRKVMRNTKQRSWRKRKLKIKARFGED